MVSDSELFSINVGSAYNNLSEKNMVTVTSERW